MLFLAFLPWSFQFVMVGASRPTGIERILLDILGRRRREHRLAGHRHDLVGLEQERGEVGGDVGEGEHIRMEVDAE